MKQTRHPCLVLRPLPRFFRRFRLAGCFFGDLMVKVPICSFCAKTGTLCPNCDARLKRGEISDWDIQSSKVLVRLEKKYSNLAKTRLKQTIQTDEMVVLIVDRKMKEAFDQYPEINNTLQKELGRPVNTVLLENSMRDTFTSLFAPMEVLGVDQIFVPDGTKELKIRLKGDVSSLPLPLETMKTIAEKVAESLIRIDFV